MDNFMKTLVVAGHRTAQLDVIRQGCIAGMVKCIWARVLPHAGSRVSLGV